MCVVTQSEIFFFGKRMIARSGTDLYVCLRTDMTQGLFHTLDIHPLLKDKNKMSDDERATDRWENEGGQRSIRKIAADIKKV